MDKSMVRRDKRGTVSIEAAIVLIAFVIAAAAFAFMVVAMGLFITQQGGATIQQGVLGSCSPLMVDGDTLIRGDSASVPSIDAMMIPLKTIGSRYVPMGQNSTEISLRVENRTAYADLYMGVNNTVNPLNTRLDTLVSSVDNGTGAMLFIGNSNRDNSLDLDETGYLIFHFATADEPIEGERVYIEIRPGIGAPLPIDLVVPPQITQGWLTVGG